MHQPSIARLLRTASTIQSEIDQSGFGVPTSSRLTDEVGHKATLMDQFDEIISEELLSVHCRGLFADGHYASAIQMAYVCLNNLVKSKAAIPSKDGAALMRTAFSPRAPILRINELQTVSDKDEQLGFMDVFAGSMTGIRNPRAHDHEHRDSATVAIELLALANHLVRKVREATVSAHNSTNPHGDL